MEKIICLWSCPRNVSTALMYSFGSREDTSVFDEPLYAHYLKKSKLKHPGREETLKSLECDGEKVIRDIILKPKNKINFHKLCHLINFHKLQILWLLEMGVICLVILCFYKMESCYIILYLQ